MNPFGFGHLVLFDYVSFLSNQSVCFHQLMQRLNVIGTTTPFAGYQPTDIMFSNKARAQRLNTMTR